MLLSSLSYDQASSLTIITMCFLVELFHIKSHLKLLLSIGRLYTAKELWHASYYFRFDALSVLASYFMLHTYFEEMDQTGGTERKRSKKIKIGLDENEMIMFYVVTTVLVFCHIFIHAFYISGWISGYKKSEDNKMQKENMDADCVNEKEFKQFFKGFKAFKEEDIKVLSEKTGDMNIKTKDLAETQNKIDDSQENNVKNTTSITGTTHTLRANNENELGGKYVKKVLAWFATDGWEARKKTDLHLIRTGFDAYVHTVMVIWLGKTLAFFYQAELKRYTDYHYKMPINK